MNTRLSDHLDLIAAAPDGMQKLRGLILELAVRGKLVPQNPEDEPASELLKRIAAEKARLVAEGKIRKEKPLAAVADSNPFALPEVWEWARLGDVTNFGQTDKSDDLSESTWVLDLEDIEKDTSVLIRKVRFAERQAKSDKNRFFAGDVLYGKLRPYLNKVIVADESGVCTTEILPIRSFGLVAPRFLMHALKRPDFLTYVNAKSYGMKMPRLGTEDGRAALFPLPPFPEQHRIVAKVDELMALCDRMEGEQADAARAHAALASTLLGTLTQSRDAAELAANWQRLSQHFDTLFTTEASLDALKQTILQLAVMGKLVPQDANDEPASELLRRIVAEKARLVAEGAIRPEKPPLVNRGECLFELPKGWQWSRLGEVCSKVTDGEHATPRRATSGRYLLSARNVTNEGILLIDVDFVPQDEFDRIRKRCDPNIGDVLISCSGSVGRVALVDKSDAYSMVRSAAMVRPVANGVDPGFVAKCLRSPALQSEMFVKSRQSAQANLFLGAIASLSLPVPPLPEQHRIVAKVDELMALCDRLKTDLAESRVRQSRLAATLIESALLAA